MLMHYNAFDQLDDSIWFCSFINETAPVEIDEDRSNHGWDGKENESVEGSWGIGWQERGGDQHTEKDDSQSSPIVALPFFFVVFDLLLNDLTCCLLFLIPFCLEFRWHIFFVEELASIWIDRKTIQFIIVVGCLLVVTHMNLPGLEITIVLNGDIMHLVVFVLSFTINKWNVHSLPKNKRWNKSLSEHDQGRSLCIAIFAIHFGELFQLLTCDAVVIPCEVKRFGADIFSLRCRSWCISLQLKLHLELNLLGKLIIVLFIISIDDASNIIFQLFQILFRN